MNQNINLISVSVVITAYNASKWIHRTLDSVLTQTYPVLEVIVIDDGSTDHTARIVQSYGDKVNYVYQENFGQPIARNNGIRISKGDFIAFVDADDYWHSQKLEKQINMILSKGLAWVVSDGEWINDKDEKVELPSPPMQEGDVFESLIMGNFIMSATPVIRRDVFDQIGYFNEDPEARIGEDWDMWLRIAAQFPLGIVHEKLAHVRLHAYSMMSVTSMKEKVRGLEGVIARAAGRKFRKINSLKRCALANIYYRAGVQLIKQNQYKAAREYFFRELQYRPLKIESWIYLFIAITGTGMAKLLINLKRILWDRLGISGKK
ncbi:MAG: glycosyltransferase [Chloroflexi bacterium]|nr:glycosyltransferase [Chloroflexota bacterium]